jgi:hypothetical protein
VSLIDDALKQAQAAHQGGRPEEGLSEGNTPWTPSPLPDRSRLVRARVRRILGWGLLGTLAGAVALVVFLRSRRPEAPPSPASAAVRASSAAAGLPPITSEVTVAPPPGPVAAGPAAGAGTSHSSASAPIADTGAQRPNVKAPGDLRIEERGRERAQASSPSPAVETEHRSSAAAGPATFAGELPLPEGGKITLDGIVYSDTNPIAVLNGKITPPGGFVEGYTITKILPDRVELEHEGKIVSITVR